MADLLTETGKGYHVADDPITLVELVAEFNALTPDIEVLKRRAGHDLCDGWSMGGEPYSSRCGCGMQIEAIAALVLDAARKADHG
jgi:hypothetical protein